MTRNSFLPSSSPISVFPPLSSVCLSYLIPLVPAGARAREPTPFRADHSRVVAALLKAGANASARDNAGYSAVHHCTLSGSHAGTHALLPSLVAAGADPNARSRMGRVALMEAVLCGLSAATDALLAVGADLGVLDNDSHSPLALAGRLGNAHAVSAFRARTAAAAKAAKAAKAGGPVAGDDGAGGGWVGARVRAIGLVSRPELNGSEGRVATWSGGRYGVLLPQGLLSLKPGNYELLVGQHGACDACGAATPDTKRCSGCHAALYCSPACAKVAWKAGHKAACGALADVWVADVKRGDSEPGLSHSAAINFDASALGGNKYVGEPGAGGAAKAPHKRFPVKLQIPIDTPLDAGFPGLMTPASATPLVVYDQSRAVTRSVPVNHPKYQALIQFVKTKGVAGGGFAHGVKAYLEAAIVDGDVLCLFFNEALPPLPF